jgi:IclR family acetate operon transcriptional repressor
MTDERYRVQSVGRAMDLLERIAESGKDGARLTDLASAVGLSKPAAYAILATLLPRGIVSDFGEGMTRRYRLGPGLLRLGDLTASNTGLADVAMPILRRLTQEIGMTSRVAILDDGLAMVIGRADAPGAIRFDAALGRRELPHCSGVGKVLLAAMRRDEALTLVRRVGHPPRTAKTLRTLKALAADLDLISTRHYAIDDEEDHEGIICIAGAIFDHSARAIGAISVTTLKQLLPARVIPSIAEPLVRYADEISKALGGPAAAQAWVSRIVR